MVISDTVFTILVICITATLSFVIGGLVRGKTQLMHKLYYSVSGVVIIWMLGLICLNLTNPGDSTARYAIDATMYIGGGFAPAFALLIALTFVHGYDKLPRWCYLLFIVPLLTNIMVWTNPLHHLFYQVFSLDLDQIVFGPYIYVSSGYSAFCTILSIVLILSFALKNRQPLYIRQAICFSIGSFFPIIVNVLTTFGILDLTLAATPLAFVATIILHGLAIFYFHMLDIKPIAMQRMLNWISDCYMVMNDQGLVVSYNQPFYELFGTEFGIRENIYLKDCLKQDDTNNKTGLYNLVTAIDSCRVTNSSISYEQSMIIDRGAQTVKKYYMVEITPLIIQERLAGFITFLKDVSKVKESMQRLADSQTRMMEQERLASLGQMVGGIAHNLKTPIMSISGSTSAIENLISECELSLGDKEVTEQDYREIYTEARDWLARVREACMYMSDIITVVKGQAANMAVTEDAEFSLDSMFKRVVLLMRHELQNSGCRLVINNDMHKDVTINGDINNMVQVVTNLINNAIDAMRPKGGGSINIDIASDSQALKIIVKDYGTGVPEDVKGRLFKQMITSKGALGTGLGIFISNSVIKAKFGGYMWYEDNPAGGAIFGISIPLEYVTSGIMKGGDEHEEKQID